MTEELKQKLLKDRKVIEEINRHLWIESEKAGFDIGFDKAAADWMEKFSSAWIKYHMKQSKSASDARKSTAKKARPAKSKKKKTK